MSQQDIRLDVGCSGRCVFEIAWGEVFKSEGVQSLQTCPLALMTVGGKAPWFHGPQALLAGRSSGLGVVGPFHQWSDRRGVLLVRVTFLSSSWN